VPVTAEPPGAVRLVAVEHAGPVAACVTDGGTPDAHAFGAGQAPRAEGVSDKAWLSARNA
ncbi:hypothetical protein AB0L50_35910, partial [Streptomyces flaveolus]|uniref:hypothetical protein n=1 Tax=Streptomyces flaveolus TaxID=67297 RepID=UPI003413F984